jgi:hypothetical protein
MDSYLSCCNNNASFNCILSGSLAPRDKLSLGMSGKCSCEISQQSVN